MLLVWYDYVPFIVQCLTFQVVVFDFKKLVFFLPVTNSSHSYELTKSVSQSGLAIRSSTSSWQLLSWRLLPSNFHLDRLFQATHMAVAQGLPFTILV